ncbi:Glycosyltransferase involved in cell wall bisynthesis [Haloarcula vallismortis]|uniref:Glycosyltransferase n=2 Tax=Haloarcula vallismortis TaxID=28442 RepID=M0JJ73_HALVA|nr:glycosyltransferase family 4 protein [Haloarcula vallismortis]EMA09187.1 glycosyltransferase [Haloarcula vallismortis ATCC 29715]SDX32684.1 Glycosyltransferase involved in cell wall bisynthesis [Haloarcula vallismortis]
MNLLVITREYPPHILGGISHHLYNLYTRLSNLGHNITILAGKCKEARTVTDYSHPETIDIEWIPYSTLTAHHLHFPILVWNRLKKWDISKFDIALTHTEIPFSLDIPVVAKYHDAKQEERKYLRQGRSWVISLLDYIVNPTRRVVDQYSLKNADKIIFNSKLTRSHWDKHYGVDVDSKIIYNGVDTDIFYPREIEMGQDFFLFVGTGERKGLPAIKRFARESNQTVYVIGSSDVSGKNIKSVGKIDQERLAEYYSAAKATIHPAEFEAFGNVILESLACGTPVIVSPSCGAAEIISDSCGYVTNEIEGAVTNIENIDSEDCIRVAREYTWNTVAVRTESVIEEAYNG